MVNYELRNSTNYKMPAKYYFIFMFYCACQGMCVIQTYIPIVLYLLHFIIVTCKKLKSDINFKL